MAYDSGVTEVQWLTQDELQVWQSYILCQYDLERVISQTFLQRFVARRLRGTRGAQRRR